MIPIKLTKKSKSKLSLTKIELESNEFNDLDMAYTYPLSNEKDIYDEINFESTNNLEIIDNLKTEKPDDKIYHEIDLEENNINNNDNKDNNDNNNKNNNDDKVSNINPFDIGSNSFVNNKEKKLIKKRKRIEKEKSPINNKINKDKLYLNNNFNINNNIKNKNNFQIVNKNNIYHPPFKDDEDDTTLKLFDNKKSNSIKQRVFRKRLKIIHK